MPFQSRSIITMDANELSRLIHDRMPVMLRGSDADAWIDPEIEGPLALGELLRSFPAERMTCYPVGSLVNSVKNNGPTCSDPFANVLFPEHQAH